MERLAGITAIDVLGQADWWVPIVGTIATIAFYTGLWALNKWLGGGGGGRGHDDNHRGYGSDFGGDC